MAEYELLFYLMRYIDGGSRTCDITGPDGGEPVVKNTRPFVMILGAFALSAVIGYFPSVGDTFCLSRMINFLPIYMIGYYLDMKKFLPLLNGEGYGGAADAEDAAGESGPSRRGNPKRTAIVIFSWITVAVTMFICYAGKWGMYSWRKWFTGRRSYEFLQDFFSYAVKDGWWIRLAVWGVALLITFAVIALIPDKDLGFITTIGARTLSVYFWHRPLCYLFRTWKVLPRLYMLFGGTYNEAVAGQIRGHAFAGGDMKMLLPFVIYCLIGAAMTAFFSLRIFEHPTGDLMKLGARIAKAGSKK
jgi:hypothetical protein